MTDGFPTDNAYRVVSDSKGYLWFCTDKGALRYNGSRFEKFTTTDGLTDNDVFNCFEDSKGRIWFYTYNGKASYYLDGKIYSAQNDSTLKKINAHSKGYINCMYEDTAAKCLYFGFVQGPIIKFSASEIKIIAFRSQLSYDRIRLITKVRDSIIIYSNATRGFINEGAVTILNRHAPTELFAYDSVITELTDNGLQIWQNNKVTQQIIDPEITYPGAYHAYRDNAGRILVSTPHGLILHNIKNGSRRHLFPNMRITCAAQDIYGNYWLTTFGHGIIKLNATESDEIQFLADLTDKELITTKGQQLFLRTKTQIGHIHSSGDSLTTQWIKRNEKNVAVPILATPSHFFHIKVGTPDSLIQTSTATGKTGILPFYFNNAYPVDSSRIIVFTHGFLSLARLSGSKIHTKALHHLPGSIRVVTYDSSSGRLYYICNNALYVFYTSADNIKLIDSNLSGGGNNNIFCTDNGIVLLLNNNRLVIYDKSPPHKKRVDAPLPYPIYDILPISLNNYIINTDEGYKVLKPMLTPDRFAARSIVYPFTHNDILAVYAIQNNLAYKIGNALYTFPTRLLNQRLHKPRLYIKSISVNNRSIGNTGQIIRVNDKTDMHVSLSAIHFGSSDVLYKYRIIEDGNTSATYTLTPSPELNFKLNAGNYSLELHAIGPGGIKSSPQIIHIVVSPSFFRSPYFYFLCLLASIAAFSLLLYYNNKRKRKIFLNEMNYLQLEHKAVNGLLNPHFVFNAINNIQNLINNNSRHLAGEYLATLSQLIRQNMENLKFSFIPLKRELDLIENYIELQNLRFGNAIRYMLQNNAPEDVSIPPLLIHTFVENAIVHGKRSGQKDFAIDVSVVQTENDYLRITITDNGQGIKKSKKRPSGHINKISLGIAFTRKRLERLSEFHKLRYELKITDRRETENATGTTVSILLHAHLNQFSGQTEYPI